MNWSDTYTDLPTDSPPPRRSGLLPADRPAEYPLAEARGCFYGVLFGALVWLCLGGALFGIGWLIAGIRLP